MTTFKNLSDHIFLLDLAGQGYLFFSPNRTNKHSIQRICKLSKRLPKRTHNEHCRTRTNRKRTAQTAYLRGLNYFVRLFGETGDIPRTYAHTCATLPCTAFSGSSSGNLSAQTRRSQIGSQCTSFLLDTKADDKKHTDKSRCDFCWSHSVIPQAC